MPSDFTAHLRSARAQITVPDVPIEAIRRRSRAARGYERMQKLVASAALAVAVLGAGAGFGREIYDGVRVRLAADKADVAASSFVVTQEPTASELRDVVARATFPVVLPVGVPAGSHVYAMYVTPAEGRPRGVVLAYYFARGTFKPSFFLADATVVDVERGFSRAAAGRAGSPSVTSWRVGGEYAVVGKQFIAPVQIDRIKAAMSASSPRASLAATEALLAHVTALGFPKRLELAERIRPPAGRSILISAAEVASIAPLARHHRLLLDTRTHVIRHLAYADGEPDFSKARARLVKTVVVPADGVRAIDAVLRAARAHGDPSGCGCEILYDRPSSGTFWVWTLPLRGSAVRKFAVDSRTFAVTPAT